MSYQIQPYIFDPNTAPQGPYLIPPNFPSTRPAGDVLNVTIPGVGGPNARPGGCFINASTDNLFFMLSWNPPNATVFVTATPLFADDLPTRQTALAAFNVFRAALQSLELNTGAGCLLPGAAAFIAAQVAAALPLRLDEILPYFCNLNPSQNYLDLQPGMRLRVETGAYEYVNTTSTLNAFVAQSQIYYQLSRDSNQLLSFDSFLNGLTVAVNATTPPQLGNLLDLTALGARRFFRLIYPSQLNEPNRVYSGAGLGQNAMLLGASTPSDLATATQNYLSQKTCTSATSGNPPNICAYFTGRAAVVPEIAINVQGQTCYVAVGTTLQQVLDRFRAVPSFLWPNITGFPVSIYRYALNSLGIAPQFTQQPIQLSGSTTYVPNPNNAPNGVLTQWDLPLLSGDAVAWDDQSSQQ